MPLHPTRCNRASLNRLARRVRALGRVVRDYLTATLTGLAMDLDGSLEPRFRQDDVRAVHLDGLLPFQRRENEG